MNYAHRSETSLLLHGMPDGVSR